MEQFSTERLTRLSGMLKRRGIILPAFEIHGGSAGLYDFGPVGGRLRSKVIGAWLNHWLSLGNIVEISCPTVTPYSVLEASGHVGEFSDFLTECSGCGEASRADHLIEDDYPNSDSMTRDQLSKIIDEKNPTCPSCGKSDWGEIKAQNLMFNTTIGAGKSGRQGFLRPETAQGMFTSFPAIYRHFRERLPFGAVQTGKGYRNEISPRQGMIRLREFNMAELEYFIDPEDEIKHDFSSWKNSVMLIADGRGELEMTLGKAVSEGVIRHPTVGYFMGWTMDFLLSIGINPKWMRFRQHETDEMAHYAQDCWDVELFGSYGWVECVGIAHRGCYDLSAHEKSTGQRLRAWRTYSEPKIEEVDRWTTDGSIAGPAFRELAGKVKQAVELLDKDTSFPVNLSVEGREIQVLSEHVKRLQRTENVAGEWYIPHVVEPAFGIDRIIWHLIDHSFMETEKSGENYNILGFKPTVSPVDVAVLPLFEKDGMKELAENIHRNLCSRKDIFSIYDGSGSIGRRYARADEIGVPWCITVDHESLVDGMVTIRERDTGNQKRIKYEDIDF
ncbi:MAG: glycine--tRNA ligase [Candidatus Poseidoniaceae archaeon]|nr:glycine--tRNA ligase [Candidatus Poseidoniaceae archaeon]